MTDDTCHNRGHSYCVVCGYSRGGAMRLDEFLLARIAKDEEEAQRAIETLKDPTLLGRLIPGWASWPKRLAECEAKRRIVERYRVCEPCYDEGNQLETRVLDWTMRLLALAHADHPDYRQEWKP